MMRKRAGLDKLFCDDDEAAGLIMVDDIDGADAIGAAFTAPEGRVDL